MRTIHWVLLCLVHASFTAWLAFRPLPASVEAGLEQTIRVAENSTSSCPPKHEKLLASAAGARSAAFHWSQVESEDYTTYIRNLRAIGCPEATIRDIVTADVHALYHEKRSRLQARELPKFWQAGYGGPAEHTGEWTTLAAEERAVLDALLGHDANTDRQAAVAPPERAGLRLEGSLLERKLALDQWAQHYEMCKAALMATAEERELTDAETTLLGQVEREQNEALNLLLTPEEREEFDLRNSCSATAVRECLLGFEVSEPEFRALFRARRALDEQVAALAETGEETGPTWVAFQKEAEKLLGAARFALFQRAQQPEFQELVQTAEDQGWDWNAVEVAWVQRQRSAGAPED